MDGKTDAQGVAAKKSKGNPEDVGGITFNKEDLERVQLPHIDPLFINLQISNYNVKSILVDSCS